MGAFTIFPIAAVIATMLYSLGAVNFVCGIIILAIRIFINKHSSKIILPMSVFLILNGIFITITTSLFLGKFVIFLVDISKTGVS